MCFSSGYIRGAQTVADLEMSTMNDFKPLTIEFSSSFKEGALMAVAWNNGTVTFVTHSFLTGDRYM